jgi:hypothetical protein
MYVWYVSNFHERIARLLSLLAGDVAGQLRTGFLSERYESNDTTALPPLVERRSGDVFGLLNKNQVLPC